MLPCEAPSTLSATSAGRTWPPSLRPGLRATLRSGTPSQRPKTVCNRQDDRCDAKTGPLCHLRPVLQEPAPQTRALAAAFAYRLKRKLVRKAPAALPAAGSDRIPIVCGPSGARGVSDATSNIPEIMHDSPPIYGKDSFRTQVAAGNNVAITAPVRGYNVAGIGIPAGSARDIFCPVTLVVGIPS
jgi:hypothetical protein